MAAYVINDMEVLDAALLVEYKKLSAPTVAQYGGRFLVRGGKVDKCEGDWQPRRLVVLEFPSLERAHAWLDSVEYAPAMRIRQRASRSNMILVEGAPPL